METTIAFLWLQIAVQTELFQNIYFMRIAVKADKISIPELNRKTRKNY